MAEFEHTKQKRLTGVVTRTIKEANNLIRNLWERKSILN